MKNRVTGIGGVFFKSDDPTAFKEWYKKHLGFNIDNWGCTFWWKDKDGKDASTQWSPFTSKTDYFQPSKKDFMINYRVENLDGYLTMMVIKLNFGNQKTKHLNKYISHELII